MTHISPGDEDDIAATDALCSEAEHDALESAAAAAAAAAGIPFNTEAERQAYLAQCAAMQAKISDAAAKRKALLEGRRGIRGGAPAPGTPEAAEEVAAATVDAEKFLVELEAAVETVLVDGSVAIKELEDAKARVLAGVGEAGGRCRSALEARLAARKAGDAASRINAAGAVALDGVLGASLTQQQRAAESAIALSLINGPGGHSDPQLAAAVEAQALSDAALAAAQFTAAQNMAVAFAAGGLDASQAARAAADLAAASNALHDKIDTLSTRRHDVLMARLNKGKKAAEAAAASGGPVPLPPITHEEKLMATEKMAAAVAVEAAAMENELLVIAAEVATAEFVVPEGMSDDAAKQLVDAQLRLARELKAASASSKTALEARVAARREQEGREGAARAAAASAIASAAAAPTGTGEKNEEAAPPPNLGAAAAAVLAAGLSGAPVAATIMSGSVSGAMGVRGSSYGGSGATVVINPAAVQADFDAQQLALKSRVNTAAKYQSDLLKSRLGERGAGRAAVSAVVADTAVQAAAFAAVDRAAESAAAAAGTGDAYIATAVSAAAYQEAARQKERLDAMGGHDLGASTKVAIASVFSAATKAQESAAAAVAEGEGGGKTTASLLGAASRAAQLARLKRAKLSSQHGAAVVVAEAERRGDAQAAVIEADAVAEVALRDAHAAADEALAEGLAAIATTAAVDSTFDASKVKPLNPKPCIPHWNLTHEP